ncbi:thermonuclease family protein [Crenobacter cavernae]|uniref:Nuclease n=1 Tax=Crenobacter cavernae TaxID=2290923 RepID=A0A345Y7V9_9NEIS|nr:thermonuclease family protein [Crenobacter cavernae]AXK40011.1 nuclease [Crenobacter cavernae]
MKINRAQRAAIGTLFSGASTARKLAAAVLLVVAVCGYLWQKPGEVSGVVVGVADGDTITVLDAAQTQHKIRFAFVDAPEQAQPWGQRAKQALSDRVYRRAVRVEIVDTDRYGREVGRVWLDDTDVNLAQLAEGYAWHYVYYAKKRQDSGDFAGYERAQDAARAGHVGLWADSNPTPPWDFRREKRGE